MRTKNYIQRVNGKLTSITLIPIYGTPSYLFAERVGLPRTVDRNHNESVLSFRKRANQIKLRIERDIRKIHPVANTGIWKKDRYSPVRNIEHSSVLSELNKKG